MAIRDGIKGVISNAITDALKNVIREASRDATRDAISQSRTHSRTSSGRPAETPAEMQSHLQVPALKLGEIAPRCIRHRPPEVITGDRLPIMALEVQIHPLAKRRPAKQRAVHPDHLWGRGRWRRGEHIHARQGYIRISCEPCGHQWSSAIISDHQWSSVVISGHQWSSAIISGHQWSSVIISGHQPSSR